MRKILFCVCFLLVCCAVYAQHTGKYKVNGKIEGMESGQVVMKQKTAEGYNELGVSDIKNGQFEFKGTTGMLREHQRMSYGSILTKKNVVWRVWRRDAPKLIKRHLRPKIRRSCVRPRELLWMRLKLGKFSGMNF